MLPLHSGNSGIKNALGKAQVTRSCEDYDLGS